MTDFVKRLQNILASKDPLTIKILVEHFAENSFSILFLLLMALPALPLPTGGVTHFFEIIAMLLALELIAGRKEVWLPKRWLNKKLPGSLQTSALPRFIRIIQWAAKYSRPRLPKIVSNGMTIRLTGLLVFAFTLFAFLAPPFSSLDTLPSLGVLLISLALIFEDFVLLAIGICIGSAGIALIVVLSRLVFKLF